MNLISRTLAVLALPLAAAILAPTAGAQTGHFGGVQSAVGSGFSSPVAVAVDTRGDIFIADAGNRRIVEEIASGGVYSQAVVAEGLPPQLTGLAVDAAGNLYFANQSVPSLQKLAYSHGAYASTPVTLAQDLLSPVGVAVDASGNVYVVDSRLREVVKLANLNGQYVEGPVVSSLLLPTGVAVDASGDLFIADEQQNAIVESVFSNDYYAPAAPVVTGLVKPYGVAIDPYGNLAVASGVGLTYESYSAGVYTGTLLASNVNNPQGAAFHPSGNIVLVDTGDARLLRQILPQNQTFGSIEVPATSAAQSLVFVFDTSGTLNGSSPFMALLGGKEGLDYTTVSGSGTTCTASAQVKAGGTCLVSATFTPHFPGLRKGAVVLLGSAGTPVATAYISGVGLSGQIAFAPVQTTMGSGLRQPNAVAVDGAGDVFIVDTASSHVVEERLSGGVYTQSTTYLGNGLFLPQGVAVDGAGNVFITDSENNRVVEEVYSLGGYTQLPAAIGTGLYSPYGIAIDGAGNLYIADQGNSRVVKEVRTATGYQQSSTPVASGITDPYFVGVDAAGNVYFEYESGSLFGEAVPNGAGYTTSQLTFADSVQYPGGFTVDSAGDLFIGDVQKGLVVEEVPVNGVYTVTRTFGSGDAVPIGVALDGAGNVYIADENLYQVEAETVTAPPAITFTSTPVGETSSDSPKTTFFYNQGNQDLYLAPHPQLPPGSPFSESGYLCSDSLTVAANQSCTFTFSFQPGSAGTATASVKIQDSNLEGDSGVTGATQTVTLTGTGTQGPQTITFLQPPSGSFVSGTAVPLNATASSGLAVSYTATATGTLTATVSGSTVVLGGSGSGTVSVTSSQRGNVNYAPATPVTRTFTANIVATAPPASAALATTAMGSSSSATVSVALTTAGTLSAARGLFKGSPGLDYASSLTGGTCTVGTVYPAGTVCSVKVTFTPQAPGVRPGAVQLVEANNQVLGSTLLSGTGTGPQLTFITGAIGQICTVEGTNMQAITIDGAGDLFAVDYTSGNLLEYSYGNICSPIVLAERLSSPNAIQIDGAGNLFVGESSKDVKEFSAANNYSAAPVTVVPSGYANSLALDSSGNLFVAESTGIAVYSAASGHTSGVTVYPSTISSSFGMVVDASENIFFSSPGSIYELPAAGQYSGPLVRIASYLDAKLSSIDAAGDLFLVNVGSQVQGPILELPRATNYQPAITVSATSTNLALTLDSAGDPFITTSSGAIDLKLLQTPPTLSFPSTGTGATSAPMTLTVANNGNAPLTLPVPATGTDPQTGANFELETNSDTTCPVVLAHGTAGTLAAGASCVLSYVFNPTQTGTLTSASVLTDNARNVSGATQSIALTGTAAQGTQTAQTITFPQPAPATYPGTETLTATANSGLPVTYTVNSGPATISGSTLTFTGPGAVSVTASQAGNTKYAAAVPVTVTINANLAQAVIHWQPSTLSLAAGATLAGVLDATDSIPSSITYTATLLPSGAPVSVTSTTVLAQGSYNLTATITPSDPRNFATTSLTLPFTVQK